MLQPNDTLLVISRADLKELFLQFLDEWQEKTNQKEEERYLSRDEVCAILNVTKPTLWRWKKKKYLIPVKVGNRPLYRQSDINKLKQEG